MTASDIANQNVSATPADCFVESKNRLNMHSKKCNSDDIVYRSKKKRSGAGAKVKRVSFHESDSNRAADFSVSFLPPNSVIKRDAVKGRYSWCGEGDAPFVRRKHESDTKSDVYLSSSSTLTSSSNETIFQDHNTKKVSSKCHSKARLSSEMSQAPPVTERGTPEGQEDPPNSVHSDVSHTGMMPEAMQRLSSSLKILPAFPPSVDWSSDNESIPASDTEFVCSRTGHLISSSFTSSSIIDVPTLKRKSHHRTNLGLLSSKTSLFNRFMKSVTERKLVSKRPKVVLRPSRSLYISGRRVVNQTEIMESFKLELDAYMKESGGTCQRSMELEKTFQSQVFVDSKEVLYKVGYIFMKLNIFTHRILFSVSKTFVTYTRIFRINCNVTLFWHYQPLLELHF